MTQRQPARAAAIVVSGDASSRGYPGAKSGAGVYQTIINQIPPHDVFIEAFAGSAQVTRLKRPATATIVIDCDGAAQSMYGDLPGVTAFCGDAVRWLSDYVFAGNEVVYCDPPYLRSVRSCQRDYYASEFDTEKQHAALLAVLCRIPVPVLLSGYRTPLYDRTLSTWRRVDYTAMTRGGPAIESLWMNFPEPFALHDYRYLGGNFRERERIKRKRDRWRDKLAIMPTLERMAILSAIADLASSSIASNGDAADGEFLPGVRAHVARASVARQRPGLPTQSPDVEMDNPQ